MRLFVKKTKSYYTLKKWNVVLKKSTPAVKAYNDYAFITDDVNEFVAIVTPTSMHLHRYSDIVSISYEENGNDMYNKSLGGAVVGGLLFGGVGAIVGSNTAKAVKNKKIEMMSIKILLKSTSEPTILLEIYKAGKDRAVLETKNTADKIFYEGLMKEVTGIKDIFDDGFADSGYDSAATYSPRFPLEQRTQGESFLFCMLMNKIAYPKKQNFIKGLLIKHKDD